MSHLEICQWKQTKNKATNHFGLIQFSHRFFFSFSYCVYKIRSWTMFNRYISNSVMFRAIFVIFVPLFNSSENKSETFSFNWPKRIGAFSSATTDIIIDDFFVFILQITLGPMNIIDISSMSILLRVLIPYIYTYTITWITERKKKYCFVYRVEKWTQN